MTKEQFIRFTKVVERAFEEGFEIDEHEEIETILCDAENFIFETCAVDTMEQCNLSSDGRSQYYYFIDNDGSEHNSTGEIFDFGKYKADKNVYFKREENGEFTPVSWFDIPMDGEDGRDDYIFVFDMIIDCEGKVVALYDYFR